MRTYKNIETWTKAMKKDTQKKLWADWFNISGHWYTCEEYDLSGHYMRYTSITARKHIDINTTDSRYTPSWLTTMTATEYLIDYLRFDIGYYIDDIKEWSRKDIMLLNIWLWDNKMYTAMRDVIDLLANNCKQ